APAGARQSLQDEASCSICLEYFNDPVTIDCGHNFCRACITQCWEGSDKDVSCPQCRATFPQRNLRPNWQLASVVEIAKQLNLQSTKDAGAGRACEKHQETLKLFCQEDQSPICVVCDRSKEHRAHTVVPAEEAAQEYKVGRNARPAQLSDIATPRCVSCSVRQILKRHDEFTTRLTQEISRLGTLISEMEGKCRQPASEFLQGFTSGRHCWEVEVDGSSWAVGVARESVTRKGGVSLEPEEGIWAVGQLNPIQYVALTSPWTSLPPDRRLRKIRVALDYKRGQVAFFNAENNTEIFTFIAVAFAGRIFPFCWVADKSSQVRMCH
uniref:Uncharacterized protein n=1 Tax=Terrapene triunguis TaxID=2587831 RepID=A0A674IR97_9SAUR